MTTPDKLVADVLAAAGARVVGRIRLQKIFYLFDQKGMGSGLPFHYHHYGPYSRELDAAIDRAKAMQGVKEQIDYKQVDGMPYGIFLLKDDVHRELSDRVGSLPVEEACRFIASTVTKSSTVLELAATIHWLTHVENVPDWKKELVRRKGAKTERGRMDEAVDLLVRLGLSTA